MNSLETKPRFFFKFRYRDFLQWEDGAMAYITQYTLHPSQSMSTPLCGMTGLDRLFMRSCHISITVTFLCEEDGNPAELYAGDKRSPGRLEFQLSNVANFSGLFPYAVCPSGHWTHEFLACDPRSNCYQHDHIQPTSASGRLRNVTSQCETILQTQFTCRNGVGRVPYSLVCDHSQDCLDSSDEDFCVHPSCSGSRQFECVNTQVCNTT